MADKKLDVFAQRSTSRHYDVWIDDDLLQELRDIDGVENVVGSQVRRFVVIDPRYNEAEVVREIEAIGTCDAPPPSSGR